MNRPWSIWWDFRWQGDDLEWVVVQTDHPQYKHIDYIYKFKASDVCDKDGYIDTWEEEWFQPFVKDIKNGQISIHTLMKNLGYKKK